MKLGITKPQDGGTGGARAAEHLRGICGELFIADVKTHPTLSLFTDFENFTTFKPAELHLPNVNLMLDQVISLVVNKKGYPREILFIGYPLIFT